MLIFICLDYYMSYFQGKGRLVVILWVFVLLVFFSITGIVSGNKLYADKIESEQRHQERLDPNKSEDGKTQVDFAELQASESDNYEKVHVGIYVDRIVEISTKATGWTVDFYIWFNWQSDELNPGETFQVIDGEIQSKTKIEEVQGKGKHYALYRVTARITKFFNVVRYPLDNHLLTIRIEDSDHQWHELRYAPDVHGAEYSSRVKVPGYRLKQDQVINKPHAYKSTRGDPRLPAEYQAVYSQLNYAIKIDRPDWGLYFKMFQGLFASVTIAFLAFLFGPRSGERVSLGIGAFFASVASSYINLNQLPDVGVVTLVDMANGLAMATIFLTLLGTLISSRMAITTSESSARIFDRVSLFMFVLGFFAVNVVMALAASIH